MLVKTKTVSNKSAGCMSAYNYTPDNCYGRKRRTVYWRCRPIMPKRLAMMLLCSTIFSVVASLLKILVQHPELVTCQACWLSTIGRRGCIFCSILSFLQPDDAADAFAIDVMSWDYAFVKFNKSAVYSCSMATQLETSLAFEFPFRILSWWLIVHYKQWNLIFQLS